jgi:hypothetical protein
MALRCEAVPAGSRNRFAVAVALGSMLLLDLTIFRLCHRSPRDSPDRNRRQQMWPDWSPRCMLKAAPKSCTLTSGRRARSVGRRDAPKKARRREFCPGCGTSKAIDLRTLDRHPLASVGMLVLGLRCSWCPGSAPLLKLIGLFALPPSRWAETT